MTFCSVVPEYLLCALAQSSGAELAQSVRHTLDVDDARRRLRAQGSPAPPPHLLRTPVNLDAPQRRIHDTHHSSDLPGMLVRAEGASPTSDDAVNEAYDGLGSTWTLFKQVFGRSSLDNAGMALVASVHYGENYDNAFWDGSQMVFGDGDGQVFLGFTGSIDVIGHELTHAVTDYTARLTYQGQSGALSEHLSDVFGSLVKQHAHGQTAAEADWLIGAELLAPGVHGVALRSMIEPGTAYDDPRLGTDPQPASMAGFVSTTDDYGGVHINSGIPNRAFALAAKALGGHAWEVAGQLWYDVLTGAIAPDCDFATFAELTVAAATTRFGKGSAEQLAVTDAWRTVGVLDSPANLPLAANGANAQASAASSRLTVRRTGGVTGVVRERSAQLHQLPPADRDAWHSLLGDKELHRFADEQPAGASRADAFCYGITSDHPAVDLTFAEPALPHPVRDLIERLLRMDDGPP